jgi:hypothetical protein
MTRFVLTTIVSLTFLANVASSADKISFKKTKLDDKFRSEGVAVGDFNHDGKLDIAAGNVYYAAPDWKMEAIDAEPKTYDGEKGYSRSFNNFAEDLNGDGWTDLIVVEFPAQETVWYENPKVAGTPWKKHVLTPVTSNESPQYRDVDGDGKRELIAGYVTKGENPDGPTRRMGIMRRQSDPYQPWEILAISETAEATTGKDKSADGTKRFSHGLGVGDVNRDGRNDILIPQGWWEGPADKSQLPWTFHSANFGAACADMHVFDFDGDGDNDVLSSAAHQIGIWWHEQTPEGWKTHEIDRTFSQTHSLCLADINGDGLPDFITGKRFWAHGPKGDVNPGDPAVMFWFELTRQDGKAVWIPHQFDNDSGVGTQFEVADVNGDGLLDVVTANKKGAHYFQQVGE